MIDPNVNTGEYHKAGAEHGLSVLKRTSNLANIVLICIKYLLHLYMNVSNTLHHGSFVQGYFNGGKHPHCLDLVRQVSLLRGLGLCGCSRIDNKWIQHCLDDNPT